MDEQETPNILAVGARLANLARRTQASVATVDATEAASVTEVGSGRQALALLRVVPFDLVAVGDELTDMPADRFAQTLRQAKPWQKWVSIHAADIASTDVCSPLNEIIARTLGALAVLDEGPDAWPQVVALARQVRARHPAAAVRGLALTPATQRRTAAATTPAAI